MSDAIANKEPEEDEESFKRVHEDENSFGSDEEEKPLVNNSKMFKIKNYNWERSYKIILLIGCCVQFFPLNNFSKPLSGIDGSWVLSINLAIKANLIWGKDYIFSYGPLGYLATNFSDFVSKNNIILMTRESTKINSQV
jgi:hypothetical protein